MKDPKSTNRPKFHRYFAMVRELTIRMDLAVTSILRYIAITRPLVDLAPNLESLVCMVHGKQDSLIFELATLFVHPNLKRLVLDLGSNPFKPQSFAFAGRFPNLRFLEVRAERLHGYIPGPDEMQHLTTLVLPQWSFTPFNLNALCFAPPLQTVRTNGTGVMGPNLNYSLNYGTPTNLYREWEELTMSGSSEILQRALQVHQFPAGLLSLHIEVAPSSIGTDHWEYLNAVPVCFPKLRHFTLRALPNMAQALSFARFLPLLSQHLTALEFDLCSPMYLSDTEITAFARAVLSLEILSLNPRPTEVTPSAKLPRLRSTVPHLRRLAAMLDLSTLADPELLEVVPVSLRSLEELDLGRSTMPLESAQRLCVLLAAILPRHVGVRTSEGGPAWRAVPPMLRLFKRIMTFGARTEHSHVKSSALGGRKI
ncbi:hypothetical protein DXG01_001101 [Tephrocybe rancida]|nr:hypothetical protein DXG01_001101 [Tephrocybe rancida]